MPKPPPHFKLYNEDCLDVMQSMKADSIDTIITDPPYGLKFMGKEWDHGVPGIPFWEAALRVLKPGAMLLAFGGTRTHHRLMCAIEDAGFEIRDCVMWLYGSGFSKSHSIGKAIDKAAGVEREVVGKHSRDDLKAGCAGFRNLKEADCRGQIDITAPATDAAKQWDGYGTALKPAWEPVIVAMKPLDGTFAQNAQQHGVAGLNVDGCRIEGRKGWPASESRFKGWQKSGESVPTPPRGEGRWPANLILDEDAAKMLDEQSGESKSKQVEGKRSGKESGRLGAFVGQDSVVMGHSDSGGASRFFYTAKASRKERNMGLEELPKQFLATMGDGIGKREHSPEQSNAWVQNNHPTVKPLKLMEYLCRLTKTPTGGIVFDPFMGSGTTGIACARVGRRFVGCEIDTELGYFEIAKRRIENAYKKRLKLER